MSFSIHAIAAIAWLLLTSANGPAFAAEPAAVVIEEVAAEPKKDAKTEKAKGNAKEAAGKVAGPLDLKAVAAPLVDALFGGGVVADVAADADAQNEAVAQQFVQQFHSILSSELAFVRQICPELAVEQRRKIVEVAQTSLKLAAKQMASQQNRQMRGAADQQAAVQDPRKTIRDGIARGLKATLNEQQLAKYTEEATRRAATRKQAAILSVVSRLDGSLCLNPEQREKIIGSISSQWQDKWEQWLMLQMYGDQYFPVMPDQFVVPHLNVEQKSVWQGLQKIDFGWWGGQGGEGELNDGWWGAERGDAGAAVNGFIVEAPPAVRF